jgi:hypothetical protein
MIIKSFTEFNESNIQESRHSSGYYESHGKTSFSRWLRGIGENIGIGDGGYSSYYSDGFDNMSTLKSAASVIPLAIKSLAKGTAAIIDLLAPGEDTKSWKELDKAELKRKKAEIIKRWETEQIENKNVTDKDAEQFYKSGVLRGKKFNYPRSQQGMILSTYPGVFTKVEAAKRKSQYTSNRRCCHCWIQHVIFIL